MDRTVPLFHKLVSGTLTTLTAGSPPFLLLQPQDLEEEICRRGSVEESADTLALHFLLPLCFLFHCIPGSQGRENVLGKEGHQSRVGGHLRATKEAHVFPVFIIFSPAHPI